VSTQKESSGARGTHPLRNYIFKKFRYWGPWKWKEGHVRTWNKSGRVEGAYPLEAAEGYGRTQKECS